MATPAGGGGCGGGASKKRQRPSVLTAYFAKGKGKGKQQEEEEGPTRVKIVVVDRRTRGSRNPIVTTHYHDNLHETLPFLAQFVAVVPDFLPPATADQLLRELLQDSEARWQPERRVVAGKEHEPKRTSLIVHDTRAAAGGDDGEAGGFVNQPSPLLASAAYQAATAAVEAYVNGEKGKWAEHPIYKDEPWEASFVVGNRYSNGYEEVQAHSDALTLLGPRPIIAGLSFGATRIFRLNQIVPGMGKGGRAMTDTCIDYNLHLPHNTLYIMIPPCQEQWKHSVPECKGSEVFFPLHPVAGETRISLTYRCNRRHEVPLCHCGTPCILHVEQTDGFAHYVWECDWARHTERCGFRKRWIDPRILGAAAAAGRGAVGGDEGEEGMEEAGAGEEEEEGEKKKPAAAPEVVVIDDDDDDD